MDNVDYNITGLTHVVRIDKDNNKTFLKLLLQGSVVSTVKINSKTEKGFRQALQELAIKGGINNLVKTSILNNTAKKIYLASWNIEKNAKISSQTINTNIPSIFTQKIDKILEIVSRNETRFNNIEERIQNIEESISKIAGTASLTEPVSILEKKEILKPAELTKSTKIDVEPKDDFVINKEKIIEKEKIAEKLSKTNIESESIVELDSTLLSEQEEISELESEVQNEIGKLESESNKEIDQTKEENVLIEEPEEQSTTSKDLSEDNQKIKIESQDPELATETDESDHNIDQNIQSDNQFEPSFKPDQIHKKELELTANLQSEEATEQHPKQITDSESITEKNKSVSIPELEKEEENQVKDQNGSINVEKKKENYEDEEF
ncbi:MAG: hypothetical protein HeimC3_08680 [Candidatus Heimdallarchaeota archaeon LC_3]|nr:MAG: hypothetical protein HeimC3_08680 [Candidatus Heimdallarchaeota archaeon LC_3]